MLSQSSSATRPRLGSPPGTPRHNVKTISQQVRTQVWEAWYGSDAYQATCSISWCANKYVWFHAHTYRYKFPYGWHVAHRVARAEGGDLELSNLQPVCSACNLSMGKKTVTDWNEALSRDNTDVRGGSKFQVRDVPSADLQRALVEYFKTIASTITSTVTLHREVCISTYV